jgi:signal transduction histidine kinase
MQQNYLVLWVSDDGTGIDDQPGAGNGLANMRDRADGLGGRSAVSSASTGGTSVEWRVSIDDLRAWD